MGFAVVDQRHRSETTLDQQETITYERWYHQFSFLDHRLILFTSYMDHNHTPSFFFFLPQWNLWDVGWLGAPHGGAHELDDDYDDDDD